MFGTLNLFSSSNEVREILFGLTSISGMELKRCFFFVVILEFRTMDKVHKTSDYQCHILIVRTVSNPVTAYVEGKV
jgi:hypothetical protein